MLKEKISWSLAWTVALVLSALSLIGGPFIPAPIVIPVSVISFFILGLAGFYKPWKSKELIKIVISTVIVISLFFSTESNLRFISLCLFSSLV